MKTAMKAVWAGLVSFFTIPKEEEWVDIPQAIEVWRVMVDMGALDKTETLLSYPNFLFTHNPVLNRVEGHLTLDESTAPTVICGRTAEGVLYVKRNINSCLDDDSILSMLRWLGDWIAFRPWVTACTEK